MADKKISQLTAASTPLAGTEVLPIVQSGSTVKVSVANLTAGRTVDATTVNATTVDATNVEVTNVKAKDGTAALTIADSTGVVTAAANPILNGGTANGVLYLNGSKVATSGSALTFDGTNFATTGTATATKLIPTGNITAGNGMYLPAANILAWSVDGTERARITSAGFLKASDTGAYVAPTGTYHEFRKVANDGDWAVYIQNAAATAANQYGMQIQYGGDPNGGANEFLYCRGDLTLRASIRSNGGLANYQSNNADLSDARTKKDITPAASMWGKIGALEIVTYKYNDQTHDDVNVGVIAQQVESVEPVWVDSDGWDKETLKGEEPLKTVYTKDIIFAAIKALQEAMTRIEQLEAKVIALEAK